MPLADFKATILVTGANGQLGREIRDLSHHFPSSRFLFAAKEELPIENAQLTEAFFESHRIDYCINCAAYTAVDKAETQKDQAFLINAEAVATLAGICNFHQARFIHISSDYVYDGSSRMPLREDGPTGPLSVYGKSKLKGEELAQKENPSVLIIRTSWVYSSYGNNFVKTMLRLLKDKKEVSVVCDQFGSPTYGADLAGVIMRFVERMEGGDDFSGIVNYCNEGVTTWFELAGAIQSLTGSTSQIRPVPSASYKTQATRPLYSALDTSKIKEMLQLDIPLWRESLKRCIALLPSSSQA